MFVINDLFKYIKKVIKNHYETKEIIESIGWKREMKILVMKY